MFLSFEASNCNTDEKGKKMQIKHKNVNVLFLQFQTFSHWKIAKCMMNVFVQGWNIRLLLLPLIISPSVIMLAPLFSDNNRAFTHDEPGLRIRRQ
jgi:hypothetical protein